MAVTGRRSKSWLREASFAAVLADSHATGVLKKSPRTYVRRLFPFAPETGWPRMVRSPPLPYKTIRYGRLRIRVPDCMAVLRRTELQVRVSPQPGDGILSL